MCILLFFVYSVSCCRSTHSRTSDGLHTPGLVFWAVDSGTLLSCDESWVLADMFTAALKHNILHERNTGPSGISVVVGLQDMWDTHLLRHANLTSVETYCISSHAPLTFRFRFSECKTYGGTFSFLSFSFSPLATENRKRVLNRCNTQISTCSFFWLCFTWNYIWIK